MPSGPPSSPAMTRDVTEFLGSYDMGPPKRWSSLRVAYHSACSMQHGQRITDEPRKLLRNAGFTVVEVPEGHLCCGSAGTYNILQPAIAAELRDAQGRQHPAACAPTWSRPATSAASPSSPAAWTSPSPTRSSCSTGPTAARCRAGWRRSPSTCRTCPRPSRCLPSPETGATGGVTPGVPRRSLPEQPEAHAHRRAEGDQGPRVPRRHDAGQRARGGRARPRGAGGARRRRPPGHRRRGLRARRRQVAADGRRGVRRRRPDRQGEGAAARRMRHAARGPDALHLPAPGARPRAGQGADGLGRHRHRLRDGDRARAAACRCWRR